MDGTRHPATFITALLLCACASSVSRPDSGAPQPDAAIDAGCQGVDCAAPACDGGPCDAGPEDDGGSEADAGDAAVDAAVAEPTELSMKEYQDAIGPARCAAENCLPPEWARFDLPGDCESEERNLAEAQFAARAASIQAGAVVFDGEAALACVTQIREAGCQPDPEACDAVFRGTGKKRQDCLFDFECRSNYCKSDGSCPGKCASRSAAGEPCASNLACSPGAYCEPSRLTCVEFAQTGDPCSRFAGEAAPICGHRQEYCVGENPPKGKAGTCKKAIYTQDIDDPCDPDYGPYCADGLACTLGVSTEIPQGTCKERVKSRGVCLAAQPNHCPDGEHCTANPNKVETVVGDCLPFATAEGEACVQPKLCSEGQRCASDDTCRVLKNLGGPCKDGEDCWTGHCAAEGTCATPAHCIRER